MLDGGLSQTSYNRAAVRLGWVHLGLGAFHRAHQAVYLDDYMEATGDLGWGIAAVNLRAEDSDGFASQPKGEQGYVLKSIAPDGGIDYRLVRSHMSFFDAAQDLGALRQLFADPGVQVASMTVTESGYYYDSEWALDLSAGPVAADLGGAAPRTIYGYLTAALAHRAEQGAGPITLMCCDNFRSNGTLLKAALLKYLSAAGQGDLAGWVRANVAFPCSMVDRITPRGTPALEAEVTAGFPGHSVAPVHAEAFLQWVLEDQFAAKVPDLAQVGVEIVGDVEPYEEAKIRILNGGHTGLCYLGALAGHQTFDQAMRDGTLRAHFDRWERDEVLPGLASSHIPFDTTAYLAEIARRFENPGIADQLERICMDGYSKMGVFIRPTMEACLKAGVTPHAGYECAASWVVYARRARAGRCSIPYHEPLWGRLAPMLDIGLEETLATDPQLWGDLPKQFDGFAPGLVAAIKEMEQTWQA